MLYRTDENGNLIKIAGNSNNGYNGHCLPVGSIFSSVIPQTSNNYHLLNGDSLNISGVYSGFYNLINTLVSQGYSLTCTANEYAEDIAKTGNCGKFVINTSASAITGTYTDSQDSTITATITVNAESFKLPTITMFIQGLSNLTNIGDSIEAGLPNITGGFTTYNSGWGQGFPEIASTTGAFKKQSGVSGAYPKAEASSNNARGIDLDASNSSSIYGKSTTVQPASTQYPYYIVLLSGSALTVEANPTLSGSEQQLNSIEIGDVKYNVKPKAETMITNTTRTNQNDTVIEYYVSSNGLTWYRKWASGWKECGGNVDSGSNLSGSTINFPLSFSNSNSYEIFLSLLYNNSPGGEGAWFGYNTKTINSVNFGTSSAPVYHYCYYCCGY